ncbi:uncharacterized protein [Solanum tuberosum]|uniref:uncharacterized protein n=1 Tax=Solanum tuberosum TaxID=4113 RepID=UPI00073A3A87|nr:PREDICTED: uncharacterized protein LOC107058342 [Solanum tuberosum]
MAGQNYPWLVGGDFNTIVDEIEKLGGLPVTQSETHDFIQCINSYALTELRFTGSTYTWCNGRIEEDYFKNIVEESWKVHVSGSLFTIMHVKLKSLKAVLSLLSKEAFGNIFQRIATLEDVIKDKEIQFEMAPTDTNREELSRKNADLKKPLKIEEDFWKQKAGMRWFKDEDRNTKFFHEYMKGRRRKLNIKEIKTMQRDIISTPQNIGDEAVNVFRE